MYGLVNKAIEDLAIAVGGKEAWGQIKEEAGVDLVAFVSMDAYPDELTYSLVGAASSVDKSSVALCGRADASFSRHRMIIAANTGGVSGRRSVTDWGVSPMCAAISRWGVRFAKGGCPASISYAMQPNE